MFQETSLIQSLGRNCFRSTYAHPTRLLYDGHPVSFLPTSSYRKYGFSGDSRGYCVGHTSAKAAFVILRSRNSVVFLTILREKKWVKESLEVRRRGARHPHIAKPVFRLDNASCAWETSATKHTSIKKDWSLQRETSLFVCHFGLAFRLCVSGCLSL